MKLNHLIREMGNVQLIGDGNVDVKRVVYDSRMVKDGDLFCAIKGEVVDGLKFVPLAIEKGASAILTSGSPDGIKVPVVQVKDDRASMAIAANILAGKPTEKMKLFGITGTNGKTTSAHILQSIFQGADLKAGRIGTVGWEIDGEGEPLERTTPEASDILEILNKMLAKGASYVAMEVTSIAMPMKRVEGFKWAGALFTNLSQDHLDLHGSMEDYFQAKKSWYDCLDEGVPAVSNIDDNYGKRILEDTKGDTITFAFDAEADVKGEILDQSAEGLLLNISGKYGEFEVTAPYVGTFNAENVLGCIALGLAAGLKPEQVKIGVKNAPQVRGRMERLQLSNGVTAIVDYAHTPDALGRAIQALRPMTKNTLRVVVGAGGDRDKTKRPIMGQIAAENADVVYVTSDNPRTEDPATIVDEVAAGILSGEVEKIVDRREAIQKALNDANEGDVVLVAGKGHEDYQEINGTKHHFDDREEILKVFGEKIC